MASVEDTVSKLQKDMVRPSDHKEKYIVEKMRLEKQKLQWEQFKTLFGPSSSATEEEKRTVDIKLRYFVVKQLFQDENCQHSEATDRNEPEPDVSRPPRKRGWYAPWILSSSCLKRIILRNSSFPTTVVRNRTRELSQKMIA